MAVDPIAAIYRKAVETWPSVQWPQQAFEDHLDGESVPYPVDLYLGGAAGHRVDPAWEVIESDFGPNVRRILQRQPTADMTIEDLWAEAIMRLIADDNDRPPLDDGRQPARIIRYRAKVKLLNYLVVIAKRIAIERQRRRRPTLSMSGEEDERRGRELADQRELSPDEDLEDRELIQRMPKLIVAAFENLTPEQQFLLTMVYREGMGQKHAGQLLGWSESKASRQMSRAVDTLRDAIQQELGDRFTPALASAWAGCWSECWSKVQGQRVPAS